MVEKLNKEQAGMLGGRAKWINVSKEERSSIMSAVALKRWEKKV